MTPTTPLWRVLHSQQELARQNARQALIVIQQRRREQEESEAFLSMHERQRTRATRFSSHTGSGDS
jgi:GAF domain-containing protein